VAPTVITTGKQSQPTALSWCPSNQGCIFLSMMPRNYVPK
jgi:hypothetical protein